MANQELYHGALAKRCITFADRCKSGKNVSPAYLPGTTGLKDVRLSANQKLHIRVKTNVSLSNGATDEASACREYDHPIRNKRVEISHPRRTKVRKPVGNGLMFY